VSTINPWATMVSKAYGASWADSFEVSYNSKEGFVAICKRV
jgi:hypothetical protein